MNLPRHVPIDDDTIIVINGISTISWSGFLRINSFEPAELEEMRAALQDVGEFHGGGGAAAEFHLTLLTHRVTEFKLCEVEKLPIKRSVFSPVCLPMILPVKPTGSPANSDAPSP